MKGALLLFALAVASLGGPQATIPVLTGPVTLQSGQMLTGVHVTSSGDCVTISGVSNVTIQQSEIGPCGGNAISVSGSSNVTIEDSFVHGDSTAHSGCCDMHDGILANGGSNLKILGNVIAHNEANIEIGGVSGVDVEGNFLLNPQDSDPAIPAVNQSRGQNFQCWSGCSNVTVKGNYALSSTAAQYGAPENQEDSINFGLTNGIAVSLNYIQGGHSPSGCGLIADEAANSAQFLSNVLVDNGQCGIGYGSGTNGVISLNKVWERNPIAGGGNAGIYVWNQYSSPCGPVQVTNNVASAKDTSGNWNSYWDGGGCGTVTATGNTLDAAAAAMAIPAPPPIPPGPVNCVISSPWSSNASLSGCAGGLVSPRPNAPTGLKAVAQ